LPLTGSSLQHTQRRCCFNSLIVIAHSQVAE
jgi:hypothetical protein